MGKNGNGAAMSGAVILLIILGLLFIFGSFLFVERTKEEEDESVIKIPEKLSDEQKEKIKKLIDDYMDEHIDDKLGDIEAKFSEIVNQKTLALGDYAVSVNEEIERNHSEALFLYSMLSDKQKEIMTTASMVDAYKKEVNELISDNKAISKKDKREEKLAIELEAMEEEVLSEDVNEEEVKSLDANKDIILEMHKSGLSILEIAKNLGLGVGEVKLIVDLYQGAKK
ncbi:MAG: hypothetical protein IJ167_04640 [Lachnospiraceae bacterium]|nr:hypothetical protein [Lachnospiraceae bacterium]